MEANNLIVSNPVDYEYWEMQELWTHREAVELLYGNEPFPHCLEGNSFKTTFAQAKCYHLLSKSMETGAIKVHLFNGAKSFIPLDFLKWAESKKLLRSPALKAMKARLESKETNHISQPPPNLVELPPLKAQQEDRIRCQTVAQILWREHPQMTIADIIKHSWMQKFGNASCYTGKHTIRNWIKDLDPRPKKEKIGRPPHKKH